ncbi:AMP-binding protein [Bradyrhizobium sp. Ash2021]|uniref:class I adenylate-forming enzyme family protein n=1 Tax=Bradyrhizobium sp. Ash2021 TaxID=2954771 RepID=UPI002814D9F6|nr:AMP-binding protein [Bradyrhizobium sp. Ash2021]WMT76339.1 AMP-binding protein [Bradyrhizobium sp. Ash2021]WMT76456.1 AMP-binding protein [Bradyrhizobium sp. Ash2021]
MLDTFWNHFERRVHESPDAVAVAFPGKPDCSYVKLRTRAIGLARSLMCGGLEKGDRIAFVAANGPWFLEWLLASAYAGFTLVPINVRLSQEELDFVVHDACPKLVVCDAKRRETLEGIEGISTMLRDVERSDENVPSTDLSLLSEALPQDPILQIYTSGTTGRPKGAVITNGNISAGISHCIPCLGQIAPEDVVLVCLPLFHIAGIAFTIYGLAAGAKIVVLPDIVAENVVDVIVNYKVTASLLVPAVIRMIVQVLEERPRDVSSFKTLVFGASPMPEELIARTQRVMRADLYHVYGLSETSGIVTWLEPEQIRAGRRLLSCGRAFPAGEIGIFDVSGQRLPSGHIGEVAYRGPQAMAGYWRLSEATASTIRDGWLFTGDAGYLDEEGYLFLGDRLKDMIKSGGENVYPAEVENVILQHPAVMDCAVVGLEDEKWGEAVVSVIVEQPGCSLTLEELREFGRKSLAGYKLPRRLIKLEALPRNSSGKVLKHVLRDQLKSLVPDKV